MARLIGNAKEIQKINDLIAFETGVPTEKLPFELVTGRSELAMGANVKILDKNSDRIFLLLTKELYLSSTSNFAKKLIETGGVGSFDTFETKDFQVKPLIVSARNIEGITLTLYEPPAIITAADLQMAVGIVANRPETADIVSGVIAEDLPEVGPRVIAAIKEKGEVIQPVTGGDE